MSQFSAAVLMLFALASAQAGELARLTARLPVPPAPTLTQVTWVARSMRINGLPMTLQAFESKLSTDAVFSHYESWSRSLGGWTSGRIRAPERQMLRMDAACCHITVEARALSSGGAQGWIAVSPPPDKSRVSAATEFPVPKPAAVVQLQEYEDEGVTSEHISATSPRAVLVESRAFEQTLARKGWTITRNSPAVHTRGGHVLEAQKGAQQASLTFVPARSPAAGAAIVIVWRKT